MTLPVSAFKAYDIRGRVPEELNQEIAEAIGRAYALHIKPQKVVVGHDIRITSPEITQALIRGLRSAGVSVSNIGECGTEEVYFATNHYGFDGGIVVTASHNPMRYNGMKLVRAQSRPVSGDTGLQEIRDLVASNQFKDEPALGKLEHLDHRPDYISHLLSYIDASKWHEMKIVVNPGNGGAGVVVDALADNLPIELVKVNYDPDGHFPNGVPNPLLEKNRHSTIDAIKKSGASLGVAWDGDFDRCFLFDESGRFIEGYYVVGLLSKAFLTQTGGGTVIHDPRLIWNTIDVVESAGGRAVMSKTGHAFIKERMRAEDAIYGGEMSAHHYFRDFAYCDSGMLPWLLVIDLMASSGKKLSELVDQMILRFPISGEINRRIDDPDELLIRLERFYGPEAIHMTHVDGLSVEYDNWRFNVRTSNTEPVVRLNVETRGDVALMLEKRDELVAHLGGDPV